MTMPVTPLTLTLIRRQCEVHDALFSRFEVLPLIEEIERLWAELAMLFTPGPGALTKDQSNEA